MSELNNIQVNGAVRAQAPQTIEAAPAPVVAEAKPAFRPLVIAGGVIAGGVIVGGATAEAAAAQRTVKASANAGLALAAPLSASKGGKVVVAQFGWSPEAKVRQLEAMIPEIERSTFAERRALELITSTPTWERSRLLWLMDTTTVYDPNIIFGSYKSLTEYLFDNLTGFQAIEFANWVLFTGGGNHRPGGGNQRPGGGNQRPGGGNQRPGGGTPPGGGNQRPGGGTPPGGGNHRPGGNQRPGGNF